jgi:hypothetical protein
VPTFAPVVDLATYLGRDIPDDDAAASLALRTATAIVQAETRQTLFYVAADTVTLTGGSNRLYLPERPIIGTPVVAGFPAAGYDHRHGLIIRRRGVWESAVTVTYSHGYATIPDDIRGATLSIAARLYRRADPDAGLIASETIGSYSVTYARSAVNAGELADDERRILARYRRAAMALSL